MNSITCCRGPCVGDSTLIMAFLTFHYSLERRISLGSKLFFRSALMTSASADLRTVHMAVNHIVRSALVLIRTNEHDRLLQLEGAVASSLMACSRNGDRFH